MTWKVRHEGSPGHSEGLTLEQLTQGLLDGHWEPTDEVMGPDDAGWVAFESHPRFAELAADLEPPPRKPYDDETRLDMTPLIDVTLVLLIFFILTTTYAQLEKIIQAAETSRERIDGAIGVRPEDVAETMVHLKVRKDGESGAVVVELPRLGEEQPGPIRADADTLDKPEKRERFDQELTEALSRFSGAAQRRTVLLEHEDAVPHGFIVAIQDAAKTADMDRVLFLLPRQPASAP